MCLVAQEIIDACILIYKMIYASPYLSVDGVSDSSSSQSGITSLLIEESSPSNSITASQSD